MRAAVAAGARGTVEVALEVLSRGGNAVDAAVAAGLAMPVTEAGLASLGGGGFMMVREPDGRAHLLDFFAAVPSRRAAEMTVVTVEFPGARQDFEVGEGSVAVPGVLPGLVHAHTAYGRLAWREVVGAALVGIREGVELSVKQEELFGLIAAVLCLTPESADVFAPDGRVLKAGDVLHNDAYVDFLASMRDAPGVLPAIGPLTAADLGRYRVFEREPLRVALGATTLVTNPPPSLGGSIIAYALAALSGVAKPSALDLLTALRDATEHNKATPPVSVRGTTHLSVSDGRQVVAMTVSNGSNAGVMLPGTGVQLNNMMGESDLHPDGHDLVPGERIRSMMAPSLVERDRVVTALGTGGSERIRSALVRVVAGLARGVALQEAIDAPRVHLDNDGVVQVEPGFPQAELDELPRPLSQWHARDFYFGGVQAVTSEGQAAADARRGGHTGRL
jgi:gamma-glutamyltranspeptidase/glutathione hydrolase